MFRIVFDHNNLATIKYIQINNKKSSQIFKDLEPLITTHMSCFFVFLLISGFKKIIQMLNSTKIKIFNSTNKNKK